MGRRFQRGTLLDIEIVIYKGESIHMSEKPVLYGSRKKAKSNIVSAGLNLRSARVVPKKLIFGNQLILRHLVKTMSVGR